MLGAGKWSNFCNGLELQEGPIDERESSGLKPSDAFSQHFWLLSVEVNTSALAGRSVQKHGNLWVSFIRSGKDTNKDTRKYLKQWRGWLKANYWIRVPYHSE